MAWLQELCEVCGGGGFFCCHRNPDLNQVAAAGCPRGGGGAGGVLQEFQFFGGQGGGVHWLVNDAKAGETVVSEDGTAPQPVAPTSAAWDSDCRRGSCSPRWPNLDVCSAAAGLPEAAPKSQLVDASLVGPSSSFGSTMMPLHGDDDAPIPDAAEVEKAAAPCGGDDGSSSMDREARVLRYREKKKRRKFGKQIRYASRKAYAETRPRIRGRFAKAPEAAQPPPLPPQQYHYSSEQMEMGWFRAFRP